MLFVEGKREEKYLLCIVRVAVSRLHNSFACFHERNLKFRFRLKRCTYYMRLSNVFFLSRLFYLSSKYTLFAMPYNNETNTYLLLVFDGFWNREKNSVKCKKNNKIASSKDKKTFIRHMYFTILYVFFLCVCCDCECVLRA